jgi:SnoaL-like domain
MRAYQAYVDKDRALIESVIADDFHFTSPLDNRLDRATYFARCWPNSENITGFTFVHCVPDGDIVLVTYEGRGRGGKVFRNTEILTIRHGKLVEAEVYFGWSLPHEAPVGASSTRASNHEHLLPLGDRGCRRADDLRRARRDVFACGLPGADGDRDRLVPRRHIERHDPQLRDHGAGRLRLRSATASARASSC